MIESTFIEIINKNEKKMVAGCIYKYAKQTILNFLDKHFLPLLEKLSHENKKILIMGHFNINLLNYDEKNTANFLDAMFPYFYLPFINNTHMEELDSVQKFIEIQGWLLLIFFICLHNQLSYFNSIIVEMSEKHDSSSRQ